MFSEVSLTELTPSLFDSGVLKKWFDSKNNLYIKSSRYLSESKTYHIEVYMECIAYDIAELIGINAVPYWVDKLVTKDGKIIDVCVSKDYTKELDALSRISARSLLQKRGMTDFRTKRIERYNTLVRSYPHTREDLDKMIIFDYLIDNYDRHLNNFEYFVNKDKVVSLSPLFDNGSSLLSDWVTEEDLHFLKNDEDKFEEVIINAETQSKTFSTEQATNLRVINKNSIKSLNMDLNSSVFDDALEKYKPYLSPLRIELITKLLKTRYDKLQKLAMS